MANAQQSPHRSKIRAWYRASRPFTLSAALAPVLVGSGLAIAYGKFSLAIFALVIIASLLVQVTANLVDEYSDHTRPEGKNKFLAPHKVIVLGLLSARQVKTGAMVCAGIAALIGLYLVIITGWPLVVVCLASLTAAYLYSAGPRPLGNIGLGHPLVFVFMGPVMVAGSYFVQAQVVTAGVLWLSIPVGCSVTAILIANDLRDYEEDKAARKVTPVTAWGRGFGRGEWTALIAIAYLVPIGLVVAGSFGPFLLLPLVTVPLAASSTMALWKANDRASFMPVLKATSRLHGLMGLLLALGAAAQNLPM
jgi:1,4-dihydroxy-2-naphthoate octaprenyltransferase